MVIFTKDRKSLYNNVAMIAQIASEKIDGNALERITEPRHFMNNDYNKILTQMHTIMNDNADPWNALPYSRIYKVYNNLFYITCDWSSRYGVFYPYPYATEVHKNAYFKGQIGFTRYTDFDSDLIVGVAPIKNKAGKIVGVYEVIIDGYVMDEVNSIFTRQLTQGLILSLIVFLIISIGFILLLMFSLRKLRDAINAVSSGNLNTTIEIKSRDEVGDLGKGFNIMAGYIRNYINEITHLNKVYFKFVPNEFSKFLGRSNIIDLKLGDQVEKEMSVLFSDIRSFTSLSETMSPEENFNFINAYLRRVGPLIRQHKGFIDVTSTLGVGTTFYIYLPAKEEQPVKEDSTQLLQSLQVTVAPIVIIDDDDNICLLYKEALKIGGLQATAFTDPYEALEYIDENSNSIKIVVSDVRMPSHSGERVLQHIKNKHPNITVIMMSGYYDDKMKKELMHLGANDVWQKMYDIQEIVTKIKGAIKTDA